MGDLFLIKLKNSDNAQNIAYILSLSYNKYRLLTLQRKLKNCGMGRLAEVLRTCKTTTKTKRPRDGLKEEAGEAGLLWGARGQQSRGRQAQRSPPGIPGRVGPAKTAALKAVAEAASSL